MKKKKYPLILIFIFLIIIVILSLLFIVLKSKKNNQNNNPQAIYVQTDDQTKEKMKKAVDEALVEKLKGMSEQKRIEFYATQFMKSIQSRSIEKAYSLLNNDFKTNYFQTEESFGDYVKNYFPKEMDVKYKNMERLGNLYVLVVETHDILNTKDPNNFSFYIVIRENDYADYELSFSVDKPMAKYNSNITK